MLLLLVEAQPAIRSSCGERRSLPKSKLPDASHGPPRKRFSVAESGVMLRCSQTHAFLRDVRPACGGEARRGALPDQCCARHASGSCPCSRVIAPSPWAGPVHEQ